MPKCTNRWGTPNKYDIRAGKIESELTYGNYPTDSDTFPSIYCDSEITPNYYLWTNVFFKASVAKLKSPICFL